MVELIKKCKELGADTDNASKRFMGDLDLYTECLSLFIEDSNFTNLNESIKSKEYIKAFEYAYSLRGVAANLGLNSIRYKLSDIIFSLKSKDYDRLSLQSLDLINELKQYTNIKNAIA